MVFGEIGGKFGFTIKAEDSIARNSLLQDVCGHLVTFKDVSSSHGVELDSKVGLRLMEVVLSSSVVVSSE